MKLPFSNRLLFLLSFLFCVNIWFLLKGSSKSWLGFSRREITLVQRLRESEDQVRWLGRQLRLSQTKHKKVDTKTPQLSRSQRCNDIHICIVCSGYNASRTVVTLIKSILYYRTHPLIFHFVSDHSSRRVLNNLVTSWNLSHVQFHFYKAETVINDVSWIPNKHYSGVYGLLKLTLPQLLPASLQKTIVLDTDVVFATDIARLWELFKNFNSEQALGLVENQSDWYIPGKLWKNHRPWPALGRGFNTGVILLDLERLRRLNWWRTWRGVAENNLLTLLSTSLADQDIINAVITRQEGILYRIPCSWNIQLSENSLSDTLCLQSTKEVNIVHFNSPDKFNSQQNYKQFFINLHQTFLQFDGNLLRGNFFYCESATKDIEPKTAVIPNLKSDCDEVRASGRINYRTHIFFLPFVSSNITQFPITLCATLSFDRLHVLEGVVKKWKGPLSLSLYLTDYEAVKFLEFHQSSKLLSSRSNIGYHIVFKEGGFYPINFLRNIGLKFSDTPYVFLSEIDFIPSDGIEDNLNLHVNNLLKTGGNKVLVVPAFESERYRADDLPGTKSDLLKQLDLGEIISFRSRVWPEGHSATNFQKWRSSSQPYPAQWRLDFEPYIVGPRNMSRYDPRFTGFGWNKVSHIYQLNAQGYSFLVLPNVFIVHLPHTPSLDIHRYRTSSSYRSCMETLKTEFIMETDAKYQKQNSP